MRRPLLNLLTVAFLALAILALSVLVTRHLCVENFRHSTDDLNWLRTEFKLTDAELERIRDMHQGYLPKCRDYCLRMDTKREELAKLLKSGEVNHAVEEKLREIAILRSECQGAMLRHFYETSQLMPREQGQRYLQQMQALAVGAHENLENQMSGSSIPHGQH